MDVFDIHHHFGSFSNTEYAGDVDDWVNNHVEVMKRRGVSQGALMPTPRYPNPNGLEDTRRMNDKMKKVRDEYGDRFPVTFGTVELRYGEAGFQEIDRVMTELELDGMMWHSRFQGGYTDDDLLIEYVERAAEHNATIVLHALPRSRQEKAWRVFDVMERFPDVQFVVVDVFLGSDQNSFILKHHHRFDLENVLFDTSFMYDMHGTLPKVVDRLGIESIAYGSDVYSEGEMWSTMPLTQVQESSLSESQKRAILYENAADVFNL